MFSFSYMYCTGNKCISMPCLCWKVKGSSSVASRELDPAYASTAFGSSLSALQQLPPRTLQPGFKPFACWRGQRWALEHYAMQARGAICGYTAQLDPAARWLRGYRVHKGDQHCSRSRQSFFTGITLQRDAVRRQNTSSRFSQRSWPLFVVVRYFGLTDAFHDGTARTASWYSVSHYSDSRRDGCWTLTSKKYVCHIYEGQYKMQQRMKLEALSNWNLNNLYMQILSSDILDINRGEYHAIYQL